MWDKMANDDSTSAISDFVVDYVNFKEARGASSSSPPNLIAPDTSSAPASSTPPPALAMPRSPTSRPHLRDRHPQLRSMMSSAQWSSLLHYQTTRTVSIPTMKTRRTFVLPHHG
ncbi:hypothetical protein GUJ93_ZPchr0006g42137 [Zizania palustris]|uniref:Uncharacterized protein n=1 Tax=Zizania palustris TaxID=103762 RepID=A0A8J5SFL8_ZIZPA|nr:hypothetical protein GUJ93_ZPchr0006g42137 [Zizania palustris]